jgi:hypothetical protein
MAEHERAAWDRRAYVTLAGWGDGGGSWRPLRSMATTSFCSRGRE